METHDDALVMPGLETRGSGGVRLTRRRLLGLGAAAAILPAAGISAACRNALAAGYWDATVADHPAAAALGRLFPEPEDLLKVTPTGRTRRDYLGVVAGIVDFFKRHQNGSGAIVDPFEKRERQYSTPAFALGAALLAVEAGREDLIGPAARAFGFALNALANRTTADNHPDFYIPLLVHAHRLLLKLPESAAPVAPERRAGWAEQFRSLVPEEAYKDVTGAGNWNLVNVAGECLRRKDGLVAPDQRGAQAAYVEKCLAQQGRLFTPYGMYLDADAPLAYDAFPRLWLEDVIADGAYEGRQRAALDAWLAKGSLSTLLLLSPTGEWASGGRSAFHQWNEAEVAVICEAAAVRWKRAGRPDVAGACKRAARLALGSIQRWRRPSGELWIVKNRAEPSLRHGYEGYSYHSQYNLLAGAMLAIAYLRADEEIAEQPTPAERGGYVFDARQTFHKVCAAGGGLYVLIDTSADQHYNASGLLRVHHADVPTPFLSDNAAGERTYGLRAAAQKGLITTGLAWDGGGVARADGPATLAVRAETPGRVEFTVGYTVGGKADAVKETYTLEGGQVTVRAAASATPPGARLGVTLPALVSNGAKGDATRVALNRSSATLTRGSSALTLQVVSPAPSAPVRLEGPWVATHNGYVRAAVADLPPGTREVTYRIRLRRGRGG